MVKFAHVDMEAFKAIEKIEIGGCFVTQEAMKQITELLGLEGKNAEELTAIRNTVVKKYGDMLETEEYQNDWKKADRLMARMSGVTAVIDHKLWQMGELF